MTRTGTHPTEITTTSTDGDRESLHRQYAAVSEVFGALAAPVRAAVVHRLAVADHSVGELVEALGLSQPLVSQHLRTLRQARLVDTERRGREIRYRLADDHVAHIFLDAYQHSREVHDRPGDGARR